MATPACSSRADESCAKISLPLSKSLAARVLVATFWSGGCLDCLRVPECDDSREMHAALTLLRHQAESGTDMEVDADARYYMGEGGTTLRFFLPVIASLPGTVALVDCGEGQRRRSSAPLVKALREIGASIRGSGEKGVAAPFMVKGDRLLGGELRIDASCSSQFVSALMLSAPMWVHGMELKLESAPVSAPYIRMTAEVMRRFGAEVALEEGSVRVRPGGYLPTVPVGIEADWSAASYFYEYLLAADADEGVPRIFFPGLLPPERSLQGDSRCAELVSRFGIVTDEHADGVEISRSVAFAERLREARHEGVVWNLSDTPDLVPALAVGCCVAGIPYRFEGIAHLRHKECDRLSALATELGRIGYDVIAGEDFLEFKTGEENVRPSGEIEIPTYGDHRIAMAFGAVASHVGDISIKDPEVVGKSFPGFWKEIEKLG